MGRAKSILTFAGVLAALLLLAACGGDDDEAAEPAEVGTISTVAGTGERGYSGDGGPATEAELRVPFTLAVDSAGNLYIGDEGNSSVRKVDSDGLISTVAGTGMGGYSGDGGPAIEAELTGTFGVGVGPDDSLYVLEFFQPALRKIDSDGIITTIAGDGTTGPAPEDGSRVSDDAPLCAKPWGPAFDAEGNIYISCELGDVVIKIDSEGIVSTVAGTGPRGFSGDGGPAIEAELSRPFGVAVSPDGSIYISDFGNKRIRKVDPDGIITTVAGTGERGYSGDGGPATEAMLAWVGYLAFDSQGHVYFSDQEFNEGPIGHRVRKIDSDGTITTVAGTGEPGFSGDGGPASEAELNRPFGVAVDADGNLSIVDSGNNRIRKVTFG